MNSGVGQPPNVLDAKVAFEWHSLHLELLTDSFFDNPFWAYIFPDELERRPMLLHINRCVRPHSGWTEMHTS